MRAVKPATRTPTSESVGFFLLLLLLFVTPLWEAPKNLLIVSMFIWWLATGNIGRELHTAPLYVKCFLLFSMFPLVTLITSDITDASNLILDIKGAIKFSMALLPAYSLSMMKKGHEKPSTWLMAFLVAGGLSACVDASITWEKTATHPYLELRGVGHVNQSALYMMLVLISAVALTWSKKTSLASLGWFGVITSLVFLILSKSLTALVVLMCVSVLWTGILIVENRYRMIVCMFSCLAIASLGFVLMVPNAGQHWSTLKIEISDRIFGDNPTKYRLHIYRTAIEIYGHHLWFGVGPDQFGKATSEMQIRTELEEKNIRYKQVKHNYYYTNHGHNIWTTVLVERGLTGIVFVALFFASSGFRICKLSIHVFSKMSGNHQLMQLVFLSGATWIILFVGGIANTTLHLEHGLIGVVFLVWSISSLELRSVSSSRNSNGKDPWTDHVSHDGRNTGQLEERVIHRRSATAILDR